MAQQNARPTLGKEFDGRLLNMKSASEIATFSGWFPSSFERVNRG